VATPLLLPLSYATADRQTNRGKNLAVLLPSAKVMTSYLTLSRPSYRKQRRSSVVSDRSLWNTDYRTRSALRRYSRATITPRKMTVLFSLRVFLVLVLVMTKRFLISL